MDSDSVTTGGPWDVESQASVPSLLRSDEGASALRKQPVYMNMGKNVVEQFQTDYEIDPILKPSAPFHQHPHLAYQRSILELHALKVLQGLGLIADVGSAARAVRYNKRWLIHCMNPLLQPGDAARLALAKRCTARVCSHRLQECDCGPFGALLFVHSLYYISIEDLFRALLNTSSRMACVVGHRFPEAIGALAYGEATYQMFVREGELQVDMRVKGNIHNYIHPPLPWDIQTEVTWNGYVLDVDLVSKLGDTNLWHIRVVQRPIRQPTIAHHWHDQITDPRHMGAIQIPAYVSKLDMVGAPNDLLEVELDQIYGVGPLLWTSTGRDFVYVPRALIHELAMYAANRIRDPALLQDITSKARTAVSMSRLPPTYRPQALSIATALAMNWNVEFEINALHTAVSRFDSVWKLHKALVSLTPIRVLSLWTVVFWVVVGAVLVVAAWLAIPVDHHLVGLLTFCLWALAIILFSLRLCVARAIQVRTGDTWSNMLRYRNEAVSIVGQSAPPSITTFPPNHNLREPLLPGGGARLHVGPDPLPPRRPGNQPTPLHLGGMVFANAVPSVPPDNQAAELSAITHRVLIGPTVVSPEAFARFQDWQSTPACSALLPIRVHESPEDFERWVSQDKFPESVKVRFRKLRREYEGRPPPPSYYKAFVKLEKLKYTTLDGNELIKPRLISGPWDTVKVFLGPFMSRAYAAVREVWDGRRTRVLYASGLTPDGIGKVCDDFAESVGGWDAIAAVWDDAVAYDSTLQNEMKSVVKAFYRAIGMSDMTEAWFDSTTTRGVTKHGITYAAGKKIDVHGELVTIDLLCSGELDTNLRGTLINGKFHSDVLESYNIPYLLLVCGDDSILFLRKTDTTAELCAELVAYATALGINVEQGVSDRRCDWEFCSKLFWWGEDPATKKIHTVLGPKPGRFLARIGANTTSQGALNFRGAMIGSYQDVHHIPMLSQYVARGMTLSSGMKSKGKEWSEFKHVSKTYNCIPANLQLLTDRYELGPAHLTEFDDVIRSATKVPFVLSFPWIAGMVKRDA